MNREEHIITLISNVESVTSEENTVARFHTTLAQPLELQGTWMCALAEVAVPGIAEHKIEELTGSSRRRGKRATGDLGEIDPPKDFDWIGGRGNEDNARGKSEEEEGQEEEEEQEEQEQEEEKHEERPSESVDPSEERYIMPNGELGPAVAPAIQHSASADAGMITSTILGSSLIVDVKCDLIAPVFHATGLDKVLRSIVIKVKPDKTGFTHHEFQSLQFHPVARSYVKDIRIEFTLQNGELVPFENKRSYVILIVKKVK